MDDNYIRNRTGKIIGRLKGEWLLTRSGQPVARYIENVDKTVTREGRIVGNGDVRLYQLGKDKSAK